jgi:hypothetical protein
MGDQAAILRGDFERRVYVRAITNGFGLLIGAGLICTLTARPAVADLWTASASSSDGALDASANFIISNDQIKVTITNLLSPMAIVSESQAVSDLVFTISASPGTDISNSASGELVKVGAGGKVTSVSGKPGRWVGLEHGKGGFAISGHTITLETIGVGKPAEMILPADGGGWYFHAHSIMGKNFSDWTDGPATFTLHLTGVTNSTRIEAVTFKFGGGPDHSLTGLEQDGGAGRSSPLSAPEPSTLASAGIGALAFVGYGLWKNVAKRRNRRRLGPAAQ